jgi:RNA methyltransferase, TrmH family
MSQAETITSAANPLLKDVRRAIARGGLTSQGWCVAETFHLLDEALRSDCEVKAVIASASARPAVETYVARLPALQLAVLSDAEFQRLSATETSQGVMALVKPPAWKLEHLLRGEPLVAILDGLQDPGNAGTIVRTAEAFGAGVIFLKGAVSPYNPKTLRASAGSLFRVPFVHGLEAAAARSALREHRVELFAGVPAAPRVRALTEVDLPPRCGLVIGSEAHGVSAEWRRSSQEIAIPTVGVESLNAAVAAAILLYEARRQRVSRP